MKTIQKVKFFENSQMQLSWSEFETCLQIDNKTFICRIPSGSFPNIDYVILKDSNYVFSLPRLELLQILRELKVATKNNYRIVIARDEEGRTTISCQEAEEIATVASINSTTVLFEGSKEISIPINSRCLVEGVRLLTTDEVAFSLLRDDNGGFGQIEITGVTEIISDEVFKYVVMTLRK